MRILTINEKNKAYFAKRYTDYIISRMDEADIWSELKNYIYKEKIKYRPEDLQKEIKKFCPQIIQDHLAESVLGKESEYAQDI